MQNERFTTTNKLLNIVIILLILLAAGFVYILSLRSEIEQLENTQQSKSNSYPFGCGTSSPISTNNNRRAQQLWETNCASCHHLYKDVSAKSMIGLEDRIPSKDWFINFMYSPDSMIKSKDPYTLSLFDSTNMKMPGFAWMHDSDITIMYDYLTSIEYTNTLNF